MPNYFVEIRNRIANGQWRKTEIKLLKWNLSSEESVIWRKWKTTVKVEARFLKYSLRAHWTI